jgi:16S rRNA (adenine1518-N6/adenine1519-N6)-dimethyltransferase
MAHAKKKSYGQHFLHDAGVIEKIVDSAEVGTDEIIVEIGPGEGALTKEIVKIFPSHKLILAEADRDLIPGLGEKFPTTVIIQGDAAKLDTEAMLQEAGASSWVLFGNLPYSAAAPILMNALYVETPPRELVIMVQKEQGDRMRAKPGEMSLLSVATQLASDVKQLFTVGPGAFTPPPKVESVVLRLTPKPRPENAQNIIKLAKAGFSARRKQLHGNLSRESVATSDEAKTALKNIGLKETARAQELSIEEWTELVSLLGD